MNPGHYVVRVLLQVVVHRGTKVGFGPVVVDCQPSADVEQTLIPRSIPANIGKGAERVDSHIAGHVTLPDREALEAAVKPVQEVYARRFGRDFVNAIRNAK